jgi:hypothetical protein
MVNKDEMKIELEKLSKIQDERNDIHIDWIKKIISVFISVTAIVISLKNGKSTSYLQMYSYLITILLSGIGIFFGIIHLYSYVVLHNRTLTQANYNALLLSQGKKTDMLSIISPPKYHRVSEMICIISLLLSFVSLIVYGISFDL